MNASRPSSGFSEMCVFINFDLSSYYFNNNLTRKKVIVNHIIFCALNAAISLLTICLNSITVITYWKSNQLKLRTSYFLIMVLSLSDLGVGMICNPVYVTLLARELALKEPSCFLNGLNLFLYVLLTGFSFMTVIVMNFEIYLSIVHAVFHRTKVTKNRLIKCLVILWVMAAAQVSLMFYNQDILIKVLTAEVLVFIPVLVFIYVRIYIAIRRSSRNFHMINTNNRLQIQGIGTQPHRARHLRNSRFAKSCFIVLVCFSICYLPSCIIVAVTSDNYLRDMAYVWSETLLLLNSSLNSLIFFWRNSSLRKEALRILK